VCPDGTTGSATQRLRSGWRRTSKRIRRRRGASRKTSAISRRLLSATPTPSMASRRSHDAGRWPPPPLPPPLPASSTASVALMKSWHDGSAQPTLATLEPMVVDETTPQWLHHCAAGLHWNESDRNGDDDTHNRVAEGRARQVQICRHQLGRRHQWHQPGLTRISSDFPNFPIRFSAIFSLHTEGFSMIPTIHDNEPNLFTI